MIQWGPCPSLVSLCQLSCLLPIDKDPYQVCAPHPSASANPRQCWFRGTMMETLGGKYELFCSDFQCVLGTTCLLRLQWNFGFSWLCKYWLCCGSVCFVGFNLNVVINWTSAEKQFTVGLLYGLLKIAGAILFWVGWVWGVGRARFLRTHRIWKVYEEHFFYVQMYEFETFDRNWQDL